MAEKFQTMVMLGMLNSRMRDYYDLWIMTRHFEFDGATLQEAIRKTFARRRTEPPTTSPPTALTDAFCTDRTKQVQWKSFITKSGLSDQGVADLTQVVNDLRTFLMPPTEALTKGESFQKHWSPSAGWLPM